LVGIAGIAGIAGLEGIVGICKYFQNRVSSILTHTYRFLQIVTIQKIVTDTDRRHHVVVFSNTYRYFIHFSQYRQIPTDRITDVVLVVMDI